MGKDNTTRPKETQAELLARGYGKSFGSSKVVVNDDGKLAFQPPPVKEVTVEEAVDATRESVNVKRVRSVLQSHAVIDAALMSQTIPLERRADIALRCIATFEGQKQVIEYDTRKDGVAATYDNLKKLKDQIANFEKYLDPTQKAEALARSAAGALLAMDDQEEPKN